MSQEPGGEHQAPCVCVDWFWLEVVHRDTWHLVVQAPGRPLDCELTGQKSFSRTVHAGPGMCHLLHVRSLAANGNALNKDGTGRFKGDQ